MKNHIYVMKCGDFMKVGMARDFKARLAHISACNPCEVSLIKTFDLEDRVSASVAEKFCHSELKGAGFHKKLEWFYLCEESLNLVIRCVDTVKGGEFKEMHEQILGLKEKIKRVKLLTVNDACNYLDSLGYNIESKMLRRSHQGPYCTFYVDKMGIKALSDYVEDAKNKELVCLDPET